MLQGLADMVDAAYENQPSLRARYGHPASEATPVAKASSSARSHGQQVGPAHKTLTAFAGVVIAPDSARQGWCLQTLY